MGSNESTDHEVKTVDPVVWGRDLERRHAWVLHKENLTIGPVERFYTGEENDRYVSAIDEQPVAAPTIFLGNGHALLAKPEVFIELGPEEASVYVEAVEKLRETVTDAVQNAARTIRSRSPQIAFALVVSAVRAQLYALEATASSLPPPGAPSPAVPT